MNTKTMSQFSVMDNEMLAALKVEMKQGLEKLFKHWELVQQEVQLWGVLSQLWELLLEGFQEHSSVQQFGEL